MNVSGFRNSSNMNVFWCTIVVGTMLRDFFNNGKCFLTNMIIWFTNVGCHGSPGGTSALTSRGNCLVAPLFLIFLHLITLYEMRELKTTKNLTLPHLVCSFSLLVTWMMTFGLLSEDRREINRCHQTVCSGNLQCHPL